MLFVNAQWTKSNRYPLNKKISPHHVEQAPDIHNIKCHAPRERVSWNLPYQPWAVLSGWSRSTWACELKCLCLSELSFAVGHAPRERVSWNLKILKYLKWQEVTLHVSVWVEMYALIFELAVPDVTLHVSVWVEIQPAYACARQCQVTLHVSVWVEIPLVHCQPNHLTRHAPRERVSWNQIRPKCRYQSARHAPRERVSWNIDGVLRQGHKMRHAPRERVSWNSQEAISEKRSFVTLHVSVWVEIPCRPCKENQHAVTLHVSVWVEMKHRACRR